ncbi:MAG: lycopene beta-cyclase CrtY [Sphingobium sp.]|nr:lycopene beta-cyclase CrtY [Sphingobium sp.]MBP8670401.1 lycopene beta-cyclase CrtY [Sphingobium sp.]MBP9157531.1 lycopene beta-cyclase CrtY [Sphingobium sp.]MCC6481383.1 lycopene beta-cyclase CrtY [Sphingomonadaceae bacterium]
MTANRPLIIVGGGLAGSLAALMLAERHPDLPLLLLEAGESFGGNHTWSFFDSDVPHAMRAIITQLSPKRWSRHKVRFPGRERELAMPYNAVAAPALDALVRKRLPASCWRLGAAVGQIAPDKVTLRSGEEIAGCGIIDARGPDGPMPGLDLGWQKFVGVEFEAQVPDPDCATIMDATVRQIDGYRFVYVLPLAHNRVLVEDTYYSDGSALDAELVAERVRAIAAERGLGGEELRREQGVLPILIDGDPDIFWPLNDPVARLGLRGGFFHPTTGYSFSLALRMADRLSSLPGKFDGAMLAQWTRAQFLLHWHEGRYFRLLNRMLFHAAAPEERYRIFQHFYRLASDLIGRFYAGRLTPRDKLRILTGRPPVSVVKAVGVLLGRGAAR